MCLQQDESQASYVALLSGSENRCFNISCEGLDRHVFAQGLGPAGVVTCICLMSQTVSLGETDALNISGEGLVSYVQWPSSLR